MTYELEFKRSALKEWKKLNHPIKEQFKKKLTKILLNPHIPAASLSGAKNLYKIKLRNAGYRLVYEVSDSKVTVSVIAIGRRNKNEVYDIAFSRLEINKS